MIYELKKSSIDDVSRLVDYKKRTVYEFEKNLEKITLDEREQIAEPLRQLGFEVECYGK